MRMLDWALVPKPPQRTSPNPKESVLQDALDLVTNLRGLGWDWARGTHVPRETRPTHSARAFTFSTVLHLLRDMLLCDAFHYAAQSFAPTTIGSPAGGSIIDRARPPLARYARSSAIVFVGGGTVYFALSMLFNLTTVLAALLRPTQFDPHAYPPFAEAPWAATSLADFWARRWHQSFRRPFIALGGSVGSALCGGKEFGMVMGAFALSGALHDWSVWGMGRGTDYARLGGFFVLNGVGIVLERIWTSLTGLRVRGWGGWLWAMLSLAVTAQCK